MKRLFPPPPADGNPTEAQAFVLALLRMNEDSASMIAEDAGRFLHARRRKRTLGVQCEWCESNGRAVLVALGKAKGDALRAYLADHYDQENGR